MNLKKPTTYNQQVTLLQNRNIEVLDTNDCISFLSKVNYYRFSAYYLPFLDRQTDKCFIGTTFERLKQIYYFDQELRALIFGIIEDIEIHVRTEISYYHVHKYGADGYTYSQNYNKKHNHAAFMAHVSSCIKENDKTLVVKHHMAKYGGKFPYG